MGVDGWLPTTEMAKRVGVSLSFFRDWLRRREDESYPEGYKPRYGVHYVLKKSSVGRGGKRYLWNSELMTRGFNDRLMELHRARRMRGLQRTRRHFVWREKKPEPEDGERVEIYCWQRGIYLSLEACQRCWVSKPESERPNGYQWEEHCQRGVSVREWRKGQFT